MKLTNNTMPPIRNYQCDKCKSICCHKDMYDDKICYICWDKSIENHTEDCICDGCCNRRLKEVNARSSKKEKEE